MQTRCVEVMIDIETTGLKPGCGIWQIGAVAANPDGTHPITAFEYTINPYTLDGHQSKWDPATIGWQETKNTDNWVNACSYDQSRAEAPELMMSAFFRWCRVNKEYADSIGAEVRYWCKGTSFDFPIIEQMVEDIGLSKSVIPWKYGQCNDLRTLCNVLDMPVPKFPGAHDALTDATKQMEHLQNILVVIKGAV